MPDNFEMTIDKMLNLLSDHQICHILSSNSSTAANKVILDCLIERISCREELLDLCDQLDEISVSQGFSSVINKLKLGTWCVCK